MGNEKPKRGIQIEGDGEKGKEGEGNAEGNGCPAGWTQRRKGGRRAGGGVN